MAAFRWLCAAFLCGTLASCGGGSNSGAEGFFTLIEFLESGKDSIPRNRVLVFKFSAPVAEVQDFFERLKIENVQTGPNSNFSRAIGIYLVTGDEVTFIPRLPEKRDRSDSGLRANANYVVFLKAGPDALTSTEGDRITSQQEFVFNTSDVFEDPIPNDPPRALGLFARDVTTDQEFELSRLDASPTTVAAQDNATLIGAGRFIEPGADDDFKTPWQFELRVSEPLDPATVTTSNVSMTEIFANATNTGETAPPGAPAGTFGDAVEFKVPVNVRSVQTLNADGSVTIAIRVTPLFALVDNTRYRIRFSGNILGIDFRKAFIGDNGLTGDGQTITEPGGLGYTAEFIVRDRPAINGLRAVTFDPLEDGINPESGQTTNDEALFNSALYNPASNPSTAVGFLSAFGDGSDGPLAVSGGNTVTIDTGDTRNADLGNPFSVTDVNPNNIYNANTLPGGLLTYDSPESFELRAASVTVSSSSTLRIIGQNPITLRVAGIVQINGIIDLSGGDGASGGGSFAAGGAAGAGGYPGGESRAGVNACGPSQLRTCSSFQAYLNACGQAASSFPEALNGEGPGRGMAGGAFFGYYAQDHKNNSTSGTGGGGGSHATKGAAGEDRRSNGLVGTDGGTCSAGFIQVRVSGIIGVRSTSGPTYGDRTVVLVTLGGSGGGGGGNCHSYQFGTFQQAGGSGGGGGGSITVIASGAILAGGGLINARGGDGGAGAIKSGGFNNWDSVSGGGGGGAGGTIVLISGDNLNLTAAVLDARGGEGGLRGNTGTTQSCNTCNAGGGGGSGFIFLMDADGNIEGFLPGTPGEYDSFANGILTISDFEADRFSSIAAITELFSALSANPEYLPLSESNVVGTVASGQTVRIFMSSARADIEEPLEPDLTSEIGSVEMAIIFFSGGSIDSAVTGDMTQLNPGGSPMRDAFLRIDARFEYTNGVEAALGPFASIDIVVISLQFNGPVGP